MYLCVRAEMASSGRSRGIAVRAESSTAQLYCSADSNNSNNFGHSQEAAEPYLKNLSTA